MIQFSCENCAKAFNVPDHFAGRSARCKGCGNRVVVPAASNQPFDFPAQPGSKVPMRTRRLRTDAQAMLEAFQGFPPIRVIPLAGDPPEAYQIEYRIHSLEAGPGGKPIPRVQHKVEIRLTSEYPRISPLCKMVTPIFHPNIDSASICVGDHWTAGERLTDLVVRIGEMIAFQVYNIRSPLNAEAAMWADINSKELPIDARDLRPPAMD